MIPYGRQRIGEDDIQAVVDVLRSDWLTTGPKVGEFESALAAYVGARYAVAVSSGTAALHAAMHALGIGPGDEIIVPPITFAATANCVLYQGGTPVFVDVDPDTLLIDPAEVEQKITPRTKAVIGVDYAGQPCDWDALRMIADRNNIAIVDDGCHALGAAYQGRKIGSIADLTVFSFHPVKHITTGEGGAVVTNKQEMADKMRCFRNHGIGSDAHTRTLEHTWFYEMTYLGYNYRITDIQCALGLSQLRKLPQFLNARRKIAARFDAAFAEETRVKPLTVHADGLHAYHLYVVKVTERDRIFSELRRNGIGVNVHYIPVYLHPFYKKHLAGQRIECPRAEEAYKEILSLPIHPNLTADQVNQIIQKIGQVL